MIYEVGSLLDKFEGDHFVIVGKGPTQFCYEDLCQFEGPIVFINDSIQFEKFASRSKARFWFAHDANQSIWGKIKGPSAAVLPISGAFDINGVAMISHDQIIRELGIDLSGSGADDTIEIPRQLYGYRWALDKWLRLGIEGLREVTKVGLSRNCELFLNSGTIHAAIHFAWLCGAHGIIFIGCDGIQDAGYDRRIALRGNKLVGKAYGKIRRVQNEMMAALDLRAEYIGTPR
ncbi:hypothetical protein LCGC14_2016670 [marine sediment metagenome]|uniref:Uncharacterized protein n=1 Tax=marine sediment metagenome TaxID=412755 RepID=A0A0F9FLB0_9ZZZZ